MKISEIISKKRRCLRYSTEREIPEHAPRANRGYHEAFEFAFTGFDSDNKSRVARLWLDTRKLKFR